MTEAGADASGSPAPKGEAGRGRTPSSLVLAIASVAVAVVGALVTWQRLFVGMDLQDESFYILVPWRWALGDKPFVDEQNLAQMPGLLEYPFIKLFAFVRDYDVTGLVLYGRHLYLAMMLLVAAITFLLLRRLVRWELALVVAVVLVTFIFWGTPQLSYNTMGSAFLTLGAVLASWTVLLGKGLRYCFGSGVAYGLAVGAYPSLLFIMPFFGIALALAMGRHATAMIATPASVRPPDPGGETTGRRAGRAVIAWAAGVVVVLAPTALFMLSRGVDTLLLCWRFTMDEAARLNQLGGADKAVDVIRGYLRFFLSQPLLIVALLVAYLLYRRWPVIGRLLLAGLPFALWIAGQRWLLASSGFVLVYGVMAPYLYLFIPKERREPGAKLLVWVWAPAVLAAVMVAYTSAAGYVHGPVGLLPALVPSGLFLAWALESALAEGSAGSLDKGRDRIRAASVSVWLALVVLTAAAGVTVILQFEYQQRAVPYSELTKRFEFGPWYGIKVTPERYAELKRYDVDLRQIARPDDKLLVFFQACGYYLFWSGEIAANSYWLSDADSFGLLPEATFDYYRREHEVPTLTAHLVDTKGVSELELEECGGLDYPIVLIEPEFVFNRKPADETVQEVLDGLPDD